MKKIFFSLIILFLLNTGHSYACVGKIINIGILDSGEESLFAELISVLINERTGTIVNIKVFSGPEEIYDAVKRDEIGVVIENTERALKMLDISGIPDKSKEYDISKEEFRNRYNLIWLKPFGTVSKEGGTYQYYYAPVITEYVLINFPALPRLISKLSDITADKNYQDAVISVRHGEKVRKAAKEFLKKKRLV